MHNDQHTRAMQAIGAVSLSLLLSCGQQPPSSSSSRDAGGLISVGDVTGALDPIGARPSPDELTIWARVRNESVARADVSVEFSDAATVVHRVFVRVPPMTATSVVSPKSARQVEISGVDERGRSLPGESLQFGVDFDEIRPAEYLIRDAVDVPPAGGPTGEPPAGPPTGEPGVPLLQPTPVSITLLEPSADVTLPIGSQLTVQWEDEASDAGASVALYLRALGGAGETTMAVGSTVSATVDGLNDRMTVVLAGVNPGSFELLAVLTRGGDVRVSAAPGHVHLVFPQGNQPPSISILAPTALLEVHRSDSLAVAWTDADPDSNAVIYFSLERPGTAGGIPEFVSVGPTFFEDPDDEADRAALPMHDVLPGLYDLVATIDDGRLMGASRVQRIVRMLPDPVNDPPQLVMVEPAFDTQLKRGDSLLARWTDADANDDARISLLLD